jgi:hypothetical protein
MFAKYDPNVVKQAKEVDKRNEIVKERIDKTR